MPEKKEVVRDGHVVVLAREPTNELFQISRLEVHATPNVILEVRGGRLPKREEAGPNEVRGRAVSFAVIAGTRLIALRRESK